MNALLLEITKINGQVLEFDNSNNNGYVVLCYVMVAMCNYMHISG